MLSPANFFGLALLGIPALVYEGLVRLRNRFYRSPGSVRRVGVPVISVGNLTVGGTGKTPMVAWLARRLLERGCKPAVVSRGYKGRAGRGPLVVSEGEGPRVGPETSGDEPYLLSRSLRGVRVIAGSDRLAGARRAESDGADVVLLDDGFQHRRLGRDLDLVLLDAHAPFGNYRLIPAGTLREPASGLERADVILITRSRPGESFPFIDRVVRQYNAEAPVLGAGHRRAGFVDARGHPAPRPERAVAFCGVGNPDAFAMDLDAEQIEIAAFRSFRDHHDYTERDWSSLDDLARSHAAVLVTTEKDLVRLPDAAGNAGSRLIALRIEATVHDEEVLLDRIDSVLGEARR